MSKAVSSYRCSNCGKLTTHCTCFDQEETPPMNPEYLNDRGSNTTSAGGNTIVPVYSSAPPPVETESLVDPGPLEKGVSCYTCGDTKRPLGRLKKGRMLVCVPCFKQHFEQP